MAEKPNKVPVEESAETVEIPVSQLNAMMERLDNLESAANQNKLTQVVNAKKPKELPKMFLKVFKGKVVTSWKSTEARYIYGNGSQSPIAEVLRAVYNFSDGTDSGPVDQIEFTQTDTRLWCRMQEGLKGIQDPDVKIFTLVPEALESVDQDLIQNFVMPKTPLKIDRNFVNP